MTNQNARRLLTLKDIDSLDARQLLNYVSYVLKFSWFMEGLFHLADKFLVRFRHDCVIRILLIQSKVTQRYMSSWSQNKAKLCRERKGKLRCAAITAVIHFMWYYYVVLTIKANQPNLTLKCSYHTGYEDSRGGSMS